MKASNRGHGVLLFIGVLLPDRAQQDDGPDAISNRSLNSDFGRCVVDFRLAHGEFGLARSP
jgi:hypothetical protein